MNVFLSHAQQDGQVARQIAARLRAGGNDVWMADEDLLSGENFAREIGQALDRSNAMVVIVTPQSGSSEWVGQEVRYALSNSRYRGRLIPVFIGAGDEVPGREDESTVPWILRRLHGVNIAHADDVDVAAREIQQVLEKSQA